MSRRLCLLYTTRAVIVLSATAPILVRFSPTLVERLYSTWAYRLLQPRLTALSNLVPFALVDVALVVVVVVWLAFAVRDLARASNAGRLRQTLRVAGRTLVWCAACYVLFLLLWGLNYRRVPLRDRLGVDAGKVTPAAARALTIAAIDRMNILYPGAHAAGWAPAYVVDPALADAFLRANREVNGGPIVVARPKRTILNWYFRRAAVEGMIDPYFLETLVVDDLLPFERPFVIAHEWSHVAGVADEGEANFLGWLACVHGSDSHQYSGWLFLYGQAAATLPIGERRALTSRLAPGPIADLRAVAARLAADTSPRISAVGWRLYDRYLKANTVASGTASYTEVVRLVLGTRFTSDWTPAVRPGS